VKITIPHTSLLVLVVVGPATQAKNKGRGMYAICYHANSMLRLSNQEKTLSLDPLSTLSTTLDC